MGINLVKAAFFTQFTFPGLLVQRGAFVDEDGMWHFPAWMCEITEYANVGYGSDDEYPCGEKADHIVTYESPQWNSDNPEISDTYTERVCWSHRDQMCSYATEHPDDMQIVHEVDIADLRDVPTKPVDLRHWVRYTTQPHSVRIDQNVIDAAKARIVSVLEI